MNFDAFLQPSTIIGFISALGLGTIVQQILNRRKTNADVGTALTGMAREVADELRKDNQELRNRLDAAEKELTDIKGFLLELRFYAEETYREISKANPQYPRPPITILRKVNGSSS